MTLFEHLGFVLYIMQGLNPIEDYIMHGSRASASTLAFVSKLEGRHVKSLNLCNEWLSTLMPHIMSKINRVSYGLLTTADLAKALADDPNMPKSRRMCAVPFVGKDKPSTASEFSHPDIVIGLTILSYRYEGMREGDFIRAMEILKDNLSHEAGPYAQRTSALKFADLVMRAGGRMRALPKKGGQKVEHKV